VFLEAWTRGIVRNSSIRSIFPSNISALSKKKMMPIFPSRLARCISAGTRTCMKHAGWTSIIRWRSRSLPTNC